MSTEHPRTAIVVRPIGTPLPLGFLGLLFATLGFSALQLGWVPPDQGKVVALGVLAFTVPAQLLASTFGFLARDPVAGTGMGVLAGTWAAATAETLVSPPGGHSPALGVCFLAAAVAMLVPTAAAGSKLVAAAVMGTSALRFAVTGVAQLTGSPTWVTVAGWTGLVLAALALYAALGFELEDVRHRAVLPVLRRGAGRTVMTDDVDAQLSDLAREAGVRNQL
jgi:succinate-acetate transporter protein